MKALNNLGMVAAITLAVVNFSLPVRAEEEKAVRLNHARELLGKFYKKSVVSIGEKVDNTDLFLRTHVSLALKAQMKKTAPEALVERIASAIEEQSSKYQLDPLFLTAMIENESRFDIKAKGSFGEIGLMQIRPQTAKWIAQKFKLNYKGEKSLYEPVKNIEIGSAYLSYLREKFDKHSRLYLAAYNMGSGNVHHALGKGIWPKDYATKVMEYYVEYYRQMNDAIQGFEADQGPADRMASNS